MFAPYQEDAPEAARSPDIASPRASLERRPFSPATHSYGNYTNNAYGQHVQGPRSNVASPPPLQHPQPQRNWQANKVGYQIPSPNYQGSPAAGGTLRAPPQPGGDGVGYFGGIGGGFAQEREGINEFETSLGLRLDYEACLAYLALPPLGAIILLILERKSDYVRFHAWQSALIFTAVFVIHLVFSWSIFFGWLFFLGDLALIAFLTMRAYRDADMLDRFEVPFFGQIASRFLDDE